MVGYQSVGMKRGVCSNCKQSCEVHEGTDGLGYCEDCLVRLGKDKESAQRMSGLKNLPKEQLEDLQHRTALVRRKVNQTQLSGSSQENGSREGLLDYIIANASPEWIEQFLENNKRALKDSYGWIRMIQQEQDELVLLRMATELGFNKPGENQYKTFETPTRLKELPKQEEIKNGKDKRPETTGKSRGRPKGSSYRVASKTRGKSISL